MSRPKVVRSILTTSLSQPIVTINGREYLYEALTHRNVSIRVAIRCEKAPHLWLAFKDLHVALNITKSDRLKLAFESVMLSHRALTTIKFPNGAPSEQRIISGEAFLSMFEIMDCFLYGTTDHIAFKAWLEDQLVRLNDKYNLTGLIPMVKGQEVVTDDYEAEDYDENDDCVPSPLSSTKTTVKYPPPKPVVKAQTMEETEDMSDDTTDDQVEILSCTDLVSVKDGMVIADSLGVAERFDKRHADVLEKARQIMVSGHPEAQRNFTLGAFRDKNGQNRPMIEMTRDGFSFLVMGFTGRKADDWKWKYIDAFNRMEAELRKPREQVAQPSPSVPSDSTVWAQILRQQGEQYKAMIESQQQAMASQQQFLGEIIDKLLTKVPTPQASPQTSSPVTQPPVKSPHSPSLYTKPVNPPAPASKTSPYSLDYEDEYVDDEEKEEVRQAQERWTDDGDSLSLTAAIPAQNNDKGDMTISQYSRVKRLKLAEEQRKQFGLEATLRAEQQNIPLRSTPHPRYKKINYYPRTLLDEVYGDLFGIRPTRLM